MPDLRLLTRRARRLLARFRRPLSAALAGIAVLAMIETVAPSAPATRPVAVASRDLVAGVVLAPSDVRVVAMPPSVAPAGAPRTAAEVVGRVVAGPLRAGEALTDRRVLGGALLAGYPRGLVAAPIRIRDAAVVGLLGVGDRIDVYAARRDTVSADRVVAGVQVVTLPRPAGDNEEGALVVLAVTADQAAALAQATATAPLFVTLLR
jgi:Flp pilus assembly protein CpaB